MSRSRCQVQLRPKVTAPASRAGLRKTLFQARTLDLTLFDQNNAYRTFFLDSKWIDMIYKPLKVNKRCSHGFSQDVLKICDKSKKC